MSTNAVRRVGIIGLGKMGHPMARHLQKAGFDARILSGGSTGTYNIDSAIDGVTVTSRNDFRTKYQTLVTTMKAAQGGTAKGLVIGLADVTVLPFAST